MQRFAATWLLLIILVALSTGLTARAQRPSEEAAVQAQIVNAGDQIDEQFVVGKVKAVTKPHLNKPLLNSTGIVSRKELAEIEIIEGPLKGQTFTVPNEVTDNPAYNVKVREGKELVLSVVTARGQKPEINIADYHRAPFLGALLVVFLAVFLFFGGKEGIKSLLGLVVGIVLIAVVLLPLSYRGFDPLLVSAGIALVITATTTTLVAGFSQKAYAATLGTIGGVIISGVAAHLVIIAADLTGLSSEEAQILRGSVLNQPAEFYSGLLAAGMLIGALGVIMDVAVSIASATWELRQTDPTLTRQQLYKRGMNVGRDIMGTMTNTLILAYAGSALPLLLLMAQIPSVKLLNLDLVATEVASALTGSLGLICTIPLTALASSYLMSASSSTNDGASHPEHKGGGKLSESEAEFEKMLWSDKDTKRQSD